MNRIFRRVWNAALQQWVVASELATGHRPAGMSSRLSGIAGAGAPAFPVAALCVALLSAPLAAQEFTVTDGSVPAVVGDGGKITFVGDENVSVTQTGVDNDARLVIALQPDLNVESLTAGATRLDGDGVAVGTNVLLGSSGLVLSGGPSVTMAGINAGNTVITGVSNGTENDHAVNFGQLDAVSVVASGAQSTAANAAAAAAAAQVAAEAAGIPWNIAAGTNTAGIGPDGKVTFAGDGNISVALTGADDDGVVTVTLDPNLTVTSITTGNATLDSNGLTITGGPNNAVSVTGAGIDAGGNRITNIAEGALTAASTDAVTGSQIFDLFIEEGAGGVRYFRARSILADSEALGAESVAIGPRTIAEGASSFAAGDGAATTETAEGAVALGQSAVAGGENTGGAGAVAVGRESAATADRALALGDAANAGGAASMALGAGATAGGASGIAIGYAATAAASNNISIGREAGVDTLGGIAGDRTNNIAIGAQAGQRVVGQRNVAMGSSAGSDADGNDNIAFGEDAGTSLAGDGNISIGRNANEGGGLINRAIGIGENASAGSDGIAMGHGASAAGVAGVALGVDARTQGDGVGVGASSVADAGFVALGAGSQARADRDVTGPSAVTNRAFAGTAVSVGSSAPGNEFTRRIVNVEDGANETDAVNVRQLLTAIEEAEQFGGVIDYDELGNRIGGNFAEQIEENRTKYVSINDGGTQQGNFDNTGALGGRSIAIGPDARTTGNNSMAMGSDVLTSGNSSVGVGHDIRAVGDNTTVIGNSRTEARDTSGVAIGTNAVSRGDRSIVIGTDSEADDQDGTDVQNSIVIGTESRSTAREGIVIGRGSLVTAARGIAQGDNAETTAVDAMAFGTQSRASGVNSQASGTRARVSGANAIATGTDATGYAEDGIAIGRNATSGFVVIDPNDAPRNHGSIAIGDGSTANDLNALALGVEAQANAQYAIAIGDSAAATAGAQNGLAVGVNARVTALNASAFGVDATATDVDAIAVGSGASASALNAAAFGRGAVASAQDASAFGQGARALHTGSVALGSNALTAAAIGTANAEVDKVTYNYAGTSPVATVSVGSVGAERTITNVAAGRVSNTSTDAINGSQLFRTNQAVTALGNNLDTVGQTIADSLGGGATYTPGDHAVAAQFTVGGSSYTTVQSALQAASAGWSVTAQGANGSTVGIDSATGNAMDLRNADNNLVVTKADDSNDVTFDLADAIKVDSVTAGDAVLDTNGLVVNDGAGNSTVVGAGTVAVTDAGGTTTIGGSTISVSGNSPIVIDGNAGTIGGLTNTTFDPDATYIGGVAATQEQLSQVNGDLVAAGLDFVGDDGQVVHRDLGEQLSITGGASGALSEGNIGVTQNAAGDGLVVELADNIALTEDGSLTIGDGTDGSTLDAGGLVVVDGDQTTTVDAGAILVVDGADETTIGGNAISVGGNSPILIDGNTGVIGGLQNQTIDYAEFADGSGRAATEEQLNLVSESVNAGWNVTAEGQNGTNVGVNSTTGNDVDLNNSDGNIVVTKADDSNDVTFDLADAIKVDSVTAGNSVLDTNGLEVDDGAGNSTVVGAGAVAVTDAGGTTTIGGSTISVSGNSPILIDGNTGVIGGLQNQTIDYAEFADGSGRAATEEQLDQVNQTANAGWNITAQGQNGSNVGVNSTTGNDVDLNNADGNIVVTKSDVSNDVTFDLADDIKVDSLTAGDTVIDTTGVAIGSDVKLGNTGLVIDGGPSVTLAGIDAGGLVIGGVADGVALTDAVNLGQLQGTVETNRTKYYSVNSTGGGNFDNDGATGDDAIAAGKDAEAEGDEAVAMGLAASAAGDASVAIGSGAQAQALNSLALGAGAVSSHANSIALGAGSATTVGAQAGYQGAFVGSSDSTGELNIGGRQITGVAAGSADTDAVNVSQLQGGVSHAITKANQYTDGQISNVNNRIDVIDGRVTAIEGDIIDIQGDITDIQGDIVDIRGDITDLDDRVSSVEGVVVEVGGRLDSLETGASGPFQISQGEVYVAPTPSGQNASAGGNGAVASGNNSVALGNQSQATGAGSTAVGQGAKATAANSTALGQGATASHANSVALGAGSATTVGAQSNYNGAYVGSSSSTGEVNVGGRTISGVAPGIAGTDAVNVNQLTGGVNQAINVANQYTDGRITQIQDDMWSIERGYRGATSSAMAMAGLPQAYLPGKSMLAVGVGGYQSEYGMAVGLSGITENGRYVYRAQASGNTARDWGFSVGAGIQW